MIHADEGLRMAGWNELSYLIAACLMDDLTILRLYNSYVLNFLIAV